LKYSHGRNRRTEQRDLRPTFCQGLQSRGFTLDASALKPSGFCNVRVELTNRADFYNEILKNSNNLNEYLNIESRHPLIDIRRFEDIIPLIPMKSEQAIFGFYKISFIKNFIGFMQYGKTKFNGTNGVLYFVAPGQKYSCTSTEPWDGYQILIHPDIFNSHLTEKNITAYSFFSYDVNESLLLNEEETINFLMH